LLRTVLVSAPIYRNALSICCTASTMTPRCSSSARLRCSSLLAQCWKGSLPSSSSPLLLPIAGGLGLSQLHYGIVLLIAMGVGAILPPAGVGFYVACAIIGTDIETASSAMLPYLAVLVIALLIVAFVPWFTVFLPGALNLGGRDHS
jgi:hypothetical protein